MPFGFLVNEYMTKLERGDPHVTAFHARMKARVNRVISWFRGFGTGRRKKS